MFRKDSAQLSWLGNSRFDFFRHPPSPIIRGARLAKRRKDARDARFTTEHTCMSTFLAAVKTRAADCAAATVSVIETNEPSARLPDEDPSFTMFCAAVHSQLIPPSACLPVSLRARSEVRRRCVGSGVALAGVR